MNVYNSYKSELKYIVLDFDRPYEQIGNEISVYFEEHLLEIMKVTRRRFSTVLKEIYEIEDTTRMLFGGTSPFELKYKNNVFYPFFSVIESTFFHPEDKKTYFVFEKERLFYYELVDYLTRCPEHTCNNQETEFKHFRENIIGRIYQNITKKFEEIQKDKRKNNFFLNKDEEYYDFNIHSADEKYLWEQVKKNSPSKFLPNGINYVRKDEAYSLYCKQYNITRNASLNY